MASWFFLVFSVFFFSCALLATPLPCITCPVVLCNEEIGMQELV